MEGKSDTAPLPMPMMTKAATPFRMPRYLTPNTTWYKKRAMRQLSPMLASPKKVRNTVERETRTLVNTCTFQMLQRYMFSGSYEED